MIKFLHTADWQIGKQFGQFEGDDAVSLADARFTAVQRLAEIAAGRSVDFVLVAGDVFDAQGVSDKTIYKLFNCLSGFKRPWIIIPGNHDAGLSESVWTRAGRLNAIPPNVHVCLQPKPLNLDSLDVIVLPAPLTQRNTYTDLTEWFVSAETPPSMYRIGLAHGSVQGILADDIDSSNPIAMDRAQQGRLDYLALGDWHGTKQIDSRTWYSGTSETDRFKANVSGQVLLVEISQPGALPSVTPLVTGQYCWLNEAVTLQIPSDIDLLIERLSRLTENQVVQLKLSGQTDLAAYRRLSEAMGQAQGKVKAIIVDMSALRLDPTPEDINALNADGYLREVIEDLRNDQEGANAEVARDALALLAGILSNRNANPTTRGAK